MVFKRRRTLKGGTKTNRNRSRSRSRSRSSSRSRSRSRPPRHRPLIILSSLSKEKLPDNELITMWTTFNDKNHGLIIESNVQVPLSKLYKSKNGIASLPIEKLNYDKTYDTTIEEERNERNFIYHALLNALIERDLILDNGSDSDGYTSV
jgi:hypothetical protein